MAKEKIKCPFCLSEHDVDVDPVKHLTYFDCLGGYFAMDLDDYRSNFLAAKCKNDSQQEAIYNALLRQRAVQVAEASLKLQRGQNTPILDYEDVFDEDSLPTPVEQADRLLLYLGNRSKFFGRFTGFSMPLNGDKTHALEERGRMMGTAGVVDFSNLLAVLKYLIEGGLLIGNFNAIKVWVSLTGLGWKRYAELQRPNKDSKYVFLAMKFVKEQQEFLKGTLSPMLKDLGLELRLLPEIPSKENLIDNKLRVAIRQSRMLICDLTHGNQGAYWEAGYAEGLGLPVIYIGNQEILDSEDKEIKPHFDVNHQNIFTWKTDDQESIKKFLSEVKAQIEMFL